MEINLFENNCPSCQAHYLQTCFCTWEQIAEAEKKLEEMKKRPFQKMDFNDFFNIKKDK